MIRYERETKEFQRVAIFNDGTPVTGDSVSFSIVWAHSRPGDWESAERLDGYLGFWVNGLEVGSYRVWARIDGTPETPVIDCGVFEVI